jgi:hypothetical protein
MLNSSVSDHFLGHIVAANTGGASVQFKKIFCHIYWQFTLTVT